MKEQREMTEKTETEEKQPRLMWLDVWRGIAVINMCLYHGLWDLVYYFRLPGFDWYSALPGYVWQQSICWSFIFLSGYSYALGKNKFRRGATILFAGALVEAVAGAFGQKIHYGILSFLGLWQLLLTLPEDQLSREMRLRSWCRIGPIGFVLCLGLFFLCRNVNQGSLGFESLRLVTLPDALYRSRLTACLGFPPADFFSLDYFSLLPWGFLFLAGYFLSQYRAEQRRDAAAAKSRTVYGMNGGFGGIAPAEEGGTLGEVLLQRLFGQSLFRRRGRLLAWVGRHALPIYLLHQPIWMAIFEIAIRLRR